MDNNEYEILAAKVREIIEQGVIPKPGSPEADILKRYDTYLKNLRSQISEFLPNIENNIFNVPAGINDIVKKEYVKSALDILKHGSSARPGSPEEEIIKTCDAIIKDEQSQISSFTSSKQAVYEDEPVNTNTDGEEKISQANYNELNTKTNDDLHITSNKQIYRPSLLDKIKAALSEKKDAFDKTIQREFRYRQFRRFKDYSFSDYVDEIFNRHRMNNQQRNIDRQTAIINRIDNTPENAEYIDNLKKARDEAQRRLESIRNAMKGQRGFAFIEEEDGIQKDVSKDDKKPSLNDPNYLKMIAGRGEGLGQFRTNYTIITRSQNRHAISTIAYAGLFAILYSAFIYTAQNIDPALLGTPSGGFTGLVNQLLPVVREGLDKLKSISTTNDIGEILNNAPAQLILEACALALTTVGLGRQASRLGRARIQRTLMEDQSYLNIGDDVDDIARRM